MVVEEGVCIDVWVEEDGDIEIEVEEVEDEEEDVLLDDLMDEMIFF